jgi:hypothetical protein
MGRRVPTRVVGAGRGGARRRSDRRGQVGPEALAGSRGRAAFEPAPGPGRGVHEGWAGGSRALLMGKPLGHLEVANVDPRPQS